MDEWTMRTAILQIGGGRGVMMMIKVEFKVEKVVHTCNETVYVCEVGAGGRGIVNFVHKYMHMYIKKRRKKGDLNVFVGGYHLRRFWKQNNFLFKMLMSTQQMIPKNITTVHVYFSTFATLHHKIIHS